MGKNSTKASSQKSTDSAPSSGNGEIPAPTPLMKQYNKFKRKHPDDILLFRVGDFYEMFGKDAIISSELLGIVLTKRKNGSAAEIELAGFPYHALETYLPKLVRAGYRVAICNQLEDPKSGKKVVKRGVTEVITPGVAHNEKILDHKQNNFLASLYFAKDMIGVAFLDISTGEFFTDQGSPDYVDKLMQSFQPTEIVFAKPQYKTFLDTFDDEYYTYTLDDWVYTPDYAYETLLKHFETNSLKGFGIENLEAGIVAAGGALHYLGETQQPDLEHITAIKRIETEQYVWLDKFTYRNLELVQSIQEEGTALINIIDRTISPMGARLLKRWILMPLKDKTRIDERLDTVEQLIKDPELSDNIREQIKEVGDLERLISKIPLGKISPREIEQLKTALEAITVIKEYCQNTKYDLLQKTADKLNTCEKAQEKIGQQLKTDPPASVDKGNVIADGVSEELDELRDLIQNSKDHLIKIEEREKKNTGIDSLKIGYNKVFGYYLEVRNTHKDKVPEEWIRKQTLTKSERYITEELKEYEEKILGAEEKILKLESELFDKLVNSLYEYIETIQLNCQLISRLDCLLSFAEIAVEYQYTKPTLTKELDIEIKNGRHPVIEQELPVEEEYIPNDVYLSNEEDQILIITGPNMSGKSALLRQTAHIVLLAQMGCFVPADDARIGYIDKLFTRVGASDNIAAGESTFMVEMNEAASIINNISNRSLILLDEIGRGTSTYDGISLAWAITEHLHNNQQAHPKTLFATHYHELNTLEEYLPRVKNYYISTKETGNKIIFLRKLKPGASEHSFGIHVAKMAGIPQPIIERANEILHDLREQRGSSTVTDISPPDSNYQMNLFQIDDPRLTEIKEELEKLDVDTLTPIDALMKINELKKKLEEEEESS